MPRSRSPQQIQTALDQVLERKTRVKNDLRALEVRLDAAGDEVVRSGDQQKLDRLIAGLDKATEEENDLHSELRESIRRSDQLDAVRSRVGAGGYVESGDGAGPAGDSGGRTYSGGDAIRSKALRSLDRLSVHDEVGRHILTAGAGDQLDAMIRRSDEKFDGSYIARRLLITEADAYRSAFAKYVSAAGRQIFLTAEENDAVAQLQALENEPIYRAMNENTTTAGGFGVPVLIDASVILTSGAADAPILSVCRIEQITSNLWSGVSSAGMTWSYTTEGTEATDNSPTLAQPQVRIHTAKGFMPYSVEVAQDYPAFATEMGKIIDAGYNDLLATKTMTGSGTNEPFGVFVALSNATSVVTPTTDGSFGGEDIFRAWNALPERFRSRSQWVMSVSVQSKIRQFAASQAAVSAYFTIDLTGGVFRINDRPVVLTDYAPAFSGSVPGTTGLANILAVGDWSTSYAFVQRAGMSVETIPALLGSSNRFPTGQRGLWAWARNGANIVATNGARMIQNQ